MDVDEADVFLAHVPKRASLPLRKLLGSAVANAEHNFQKDRGVLFVEMIRVDGGPVLKRFRARAFGRASDIHKRTSHVTLALGEHTRKARKRFVTKTAAPKVESPTLEELGEGTVKKTWKAPQREERTSGMRKRFVDIGKRFFRRKSV